MVAGQGSIQTAGSVMKIQQTSERLVTDWQSFSIGQGSTVQFVQPSSSAVALNRVLGNDVSVIQGALQANGQVFLVNPNGVLFSKEAQVNVGGVVASTLNISTADFMAGNYRFAGTSSNAIVNHGNITASQGGTVALIAVKITNTGQIQAEGGQVLMGAGSKVKLDLGGPVKIEVEEGALDALIQQGGGVRADGGLVYLTAKSVGQLVTTVINHTGITEARTLASGQSGEIYLMGGMDKDRVVVVGTLDASAPHGGQGGFIETSAASLQIQPTVQVNTLAVAGKAGTWLIDPADFTISAGTGAQTDNSIGADTLSAALNGSNVTIQTAATLAAGNGDIFVNAAVAKTSGSATTLTLAADRSILVASPGAISGSLNSPLNVVLAARARGGAQGQVIIRGSIRSFGGNITVGGGDTTASGYAVGVTGTSVAPFTSSEQNIGVQIAGAVVDATADGSGSANATLPTAAAGGDITIRGKGYALVSAQASWGLHMISNGSVITGGAGNIDITGYGGYANNFYYALGSTGVVLESNAYVKANTGNVSIKGYAGSGPSAYGIASTQSNKLIGTNGMLLFDGDSLMLRDGTLTVFAGQASDIKMPIIGCVTGGTCSSTPGFTKSGSGTLNLWGNAEYWNSNRPNGSTVATTRNAVFTDSNNSVNIVGITADQALYAFGTRPTTVTQVAQSTAGAIVSLTPTLSNVGDTGSLIYYNGIDYSLDSYWSSTNVFGRSLVLGTDYNFLYNSSPVSSFKNAGTYSVTLNLLNTSAYALSGGTTSATFKITPKSLSITSPTIASHAYDGSTAAGALTLGTLTGFVGSETVTASGTAAALASKDVGSYTTSVAYTLANGANGGLASNYALASSTGISASITRKPVDTTEAVASSAAIAINMDVARQPDSMKIQSSGLVLVYSEDAPSASTGAETAKPVMVPGNAGRDSIGFMKMFVVRGGLNTNFESVQGQSN